MAEGADFTEHLNEFDKIVAKLAAVGAKIDAEDQAILLLVSLPPSYEHIKTTLAHEKDSIKLDDIVSALNKEKTTSVQFSSEEKCNFARLGCENDEITKPTQRVDQTAARRMIFHALGRNIRATTVEVGTHMNAQEKDFRPLNPRGGTRMNTHVGSKDSALSAMAGAQASEIPGERPDMKAEQLGAAKRMFPHDLIFQPEKDGVPPRRSALTRAW